MNLLFRAAILLFFMLFLCLTACSKLSQKNFNKIQLNMTMQEVITILGEPSSSENLNIAGISGTSAVWKDKNNEIDIQFLNNLVVVKSFSQENDEPKKQS